MRPPSRALPPAWLACCLGLVGGSAAALSASDATPDLRGASRGKIKTDWIIDKAPPYNWRMDGFNGCQVTYVAPDKRERRPAWLVGLSKDATPWASGFFRTNGPTRSDNSFPLRPDQRDGHLVFEVNGSAGPDGTHLGGQWFKIRINDVGDDDLPYHHDQVPAVECTDYLPNHAVDGDAATWQTVRIPMKTMLGPGTLDHIGVVMIQYGDPLPKVGLQIRQIRVETPIRKRPLSP